MIRRFLADRAGTTAIEYCVIAGLIFLAIVSAPLPIGQTLANMFSQVVAGLEG